MNSAQTGTLYISKKHYKKVQNALFLFVIHFYGIYKNVYKYGYIAQCSLYCFIYL